MGRAFCPPLYYIVSMSDYVHMTDRELLLVVVERQKHHLDSHELLSGKVSRIEAKLIEDIEDRIRRLEADRFERKGMMKLWLFIIGLLSAISVSLSIYKFIN